MFHFVEAESQEVSSSSSDMLSRSIQLAVEYNAQLAEQRRTLRNTYLDTQTKVFVPDLWSEGGGGGVRERERDTERERQ